MRVFNFLMIKVDVPIISGNFRVDFLIEIFMQFFWKSHEIQIPVPFLFLPVQAFLFQNSSDPDITSNITYFLLYWKHRKLVSNNKQLKYTKKLHNI